jgi:hypothetical protein
MSWLADPLDDSHHEARIIESRQSEFIRSAGNRVGQYDHLKLCHDSIFTICRAYVSVADSKLVSVDGNSV